MERVTEETGGDEEVAMSEAVGRMALAHAQSLNLEGKEGSSSNGLAGEEEEETLEIKLEGAGHEALDCMCRPVGGDAGSVTYQCSYQMGTDKGGKKGGKTTAGRIQGKFAINLP